MFGHCRAAAPLGAAPAARSARCRRDTGGITEFVPLPFVHMEAPIYLRGQARTGPTWREAVLMHAVARLALHRADRQHPGVLGEAGRGRRRGAACDAGVNDLGGTLMNESITRAAGAAHGQELTADTISTLIRSAGRTPRRRLTDYRLAEATTQAAA